MRALIDCCIAVMVDRSDCMSVAIGTDGASVAGAPSASVVVAPVVWLPFAFPSFAVPVCPAWGVPIPNHACCSGSGPRRSSAVVVAACCAVAAGCAGAAGCARCGCVGLELPGRTRRRDPMFIPAGVASPVLFPLPFGDGNNC